jgi:hypothetical protein
MSETLQVSTCYSGVANLSVVSVELSIMTPLEHMWSVEMEEEVEKEDPWCNLRNFSVISVERPTSTSPLLGLRLGVRFLHLLWRRRLSPRLRWNPRPMAAPAFLLRRRNVHNA